MSAATQTQWKRGRTPMDYHGHGLFPNAGARARPRPSSHSQTSAMHAAEPNEGIGIDGSTHSSPTLSVEVSWSKPSQSSLDRPVLLTADALDPW